VSKSDPIAAKWQSTKLDIVKAKYEHFVKSGGSSRQNVNDLLKAIVEALIDSEQGASAQKSTTTTSTTE
jgi:hypothetical protein